MDPELMQCVVISSYLPMLQEDKVHTSQGYAARSSYICSLGYSQLVKLALLESYKSVILHEAMIWLTRYTVDNIRKTLAKVERLSAGLWQQRHFDSQVDQLKSACNSHKLQRESASFILAVGREVLALKSALRSFCSLCFFLSIHLMDSKLENLYSCFPMQGFKKKSLHYA